MVGSARCWSLLVGLALVAGCTGEAGSLVYVIGVGLGLGLLHGASDLCLVKASQRKCFVVTYLSVAMAYLVLWRISGCLALTLFLVLSAWHFAHEDDLFHHRHQQMANGLFILGGPAMLHSTEVASLLNVAMGAEPKSMLGAGLALSLGSVGIVAGAVLAGAAWSRRSLRLALSLALIVLMPPLISFALGFLLLHAWPQTLARQRALNTPTLPSYLCKTWPALVGALAFALIAGAYFLQQEQTGIRALFALLAAFALPHMLVLPRFLSGSHGQLRLHRGGL